MDIKFGTDGVRGIIDSTFNELIVATIAEAALRHWSRQYGAKRVLVGYDTRRKSKEYAGVAASVAVSHGLDVLITDSPTPTPTVAWAVKRLGFDLGFQITASHNPPQYNGIKIITVEGSSAFPSDTGEVERIIREEEGDIIKTIRDVPNRPIPTISLREQYVSYVLSWLEDKMDAVNKSLKVVVDPMHGAAVGYTATILRMLGMDVKEMHGTHDQAFGGLEPEPEERNLGEMVMAVDKGDFDLGIAHDGDADRLAVAVKGLGFLGANKVIPLMISKLSEFGLIKKGLGRTVATTHLVDCLASRLGVPLYETPVGIKYISELIINGKIDVGGEESGGLAYSWHVPEKDGIYSGSLFAALIGKNASEEATKVSSICGDLYSSRIDVKMQNSKEFVMNNADRITKALSTLGKVKQIINIDGVKVIYEDGSWLLVRGSGTEPKLRIYVESRDRETAEETLERAASMMLELSRA